MPKSEKKQIKTSTSYEKESIKFATTETMDLIKAILYWGGMLTFAVSVFMWVFTDIKYLTYAAGMIGITMFLTSIIIFFIEMKELLSGE